MKPFALAAAVAVTLGAAPALATEFGDAQDAAATMAAIKICNTVVSEAAKRVLYGEILSIYRTPHMVASVIDDEIEALNKLSPSDRTAMCLALGDRVKAIADGDRPQPQDNDHASFRVVIDSAQAACGAGEIMVSAYCAGGVAIRIDGTTGASCDGGAKAVILCAK
jgi:hypothetical protein